MLLVPLLDSPSSEYKRIIYSSGLNLEVLNPLSIVLAVCPVFFQSSSPMKAQESLHVLHKYF